MLFFAFFLTACEAEAPVEEVPDAEFTLVSPQGGDFVPAGATKAAGRALHVSDVAVNGVSATVDAGKFAADVELVRGVNVVEATATDEQGDGQYIRNGVLAGDFTEASGLVEDAVRLRVNQGGLDRIGELASESIDSSIINDSLAAVNPVYSDSYAWDTVTIAADVQSVTFDAARFDFTPRDGALGLEVELPNLYVDIYAYGEAIGFDFDSDVAMWASSAVLTADVYASASGGDLHVDIGEVSVELRDFGYDTSLLPGSVEDYLLVDTIRSTIEDMLVEKIQEMVPPLLDETLAGLDPSYSTEMMGLTVDMAFSFADVDVDDDGLVLAMDLDVEVPDDGRHSGPGFLVAPLATPDVDTHADLAGAVSDDLLNRMLYEVWAGGLLDMRLSTDDGSLDPLMLVPLKVSEGTITLEAPLPPVVVERNGELQAQIGELRVEIEAPGSPIGDRLLATVNAFVPITVSAEEGELTLELGTPEVVLMVRESSSGGSEEATTALVEQTLPLEAIFVLLGDFSFPLPALYGIEVDEGVAARDDGGSHTALEVSLK